MGDVKWIREQIAEWIFNFMVRNKKTTALVHSPDPDKIASELEDMETLAQKVTTSEVKAKKAHDFMRRYRAWRNRMMVMEQGFWTEAAELLGEHDEPHPPDEES